MNVLKERIHDWVALQKSSSVSPKAEAKSPGSLQQ
jgi:hypothetical protein